MKCSDFQERLNELLDRRMLPLDDAQLREHSSLCDSCRATLLHWQHIDANLLPSQPAEAVRPLEGRTCQHSVASSLGTDEFPSTSSVSCQTVQRPARLSMGPAWLPASVAVAIAWLFFGLTGNSPTSTQFDPAPHIALAPATTSPAPGYQSQPELSRSISQTAVFPAASASVSPQSLDLNQLSFRVAEPDWWGSVVVAAWKPVDPLTESIRPLADSLQNALLLLTPQSHRLTPGKSLPISNDAAVSRVSFLNSIA